MRKIESLFIGAACLATVTGAGVAIWNYENISSKNAAHTFPTTPHGAYLAARHAIYVNDFDRAVVFSEKLADVPFDSVKSVRSLSSFLAGKMPETSSDMQKVSAPVAKLIYDAHLVLNDDWDTFYKRHKNDKSALMAPFKIWSMIGNNRRTEALKFVDSTPTNDAWKSFMRGQIYAETGNTKRAAEEFANVRCDFMNINDYRYIMSFYIHNDMHDAADGLRHDFTSHLGGMYMLEYTDIPAWETFAGTKNALAFSLVQTVSHTQIMMYSDLSLLMLRFAEITGPNFDSNNDAINYYLGQFFFNNGGDYQTYFDRIDPSSPYYLFGALRNAERGGNIAALERIVNINPLFVPAVERLVGYHVQQGNYRKALRTIKRSLDNPNLTENGRARFLRNRAYVHYIFGKYDDAQRDINSATDVLPTDGDGMIIQALVWAAKNQELDRAYDYAMTVLIRDVRNVRAWDAVGVTVAAREGVAEGIKILTEVSERAHECSSLYMHLGDMYVQMGNIEQARKAYQAAIDLSNDGLVRMSVVQEKLRKLK